MRYAIRLHFPTSNNVAEYEALVNGLHIATELGIKWLDVRGDSRLIIDQVMKESSCHDPKMDAYCKVVRRLEEKFDGLELNHVLRKYNEATDALAKMASEWATVPPDVFVSDLYKPSIDYKEDGGSDPPPTNLGLDLEPPTAPEPEAMDIESEAPARDDLSNWRYPLLQRLIDGTLPPDQAEARRIARHAKALVLLDGEMYKRSPSGILMHCITHQEGIKLLEEIHSGACGHHAAPRTLVGNSFRQGFYWPTAVADATQIVWTCEGCQFYARQIHLQAQALQTIPITWPFAVCGLDLVGPLQKALGGFTHLLLAIDKFSKRIEVQPITRIKAEQAVLFCTDIIHRFGVPNSIITDNGTQFTGQKFLEFCDRHHIRVDWAAVAHPKTNGQVERANGMILQGLKPRIFNRLDKFRKKWLKELPAVIWSLRTSQSRATGFTPFFMVYGFEAVLPTDLKYGSPRVQAYDENSYKTFQEDALDQLDEARDVALLHSAKYQQALRHYHARRVRGRAFKVSDLVLRLRQSNKGRHKLTPPWEGPFVIAEVLRPDTYKLANEAREVYNNTLNIEHLRRFYP